MKADDTENTVKYFIGDNTYEIPKEVPFEDWKRIIRDSIPYHFKTVPMSSWSDSDYEENRNFGCRLVIINTLEEIGEANWDNDHFKWKEVARLGINLSDWSGTISDLL